MWGGGGDNWKIKWRPTANILYVNLDSRKSRMISKDIKTSNVISRLKFLCKFNKNVKNLRHKSKKNGKLIIICTFYRQNWGKSLIFPWYLDWKDAQASLNQDIKRHKDKDKKNLFTLVETILVGV